MRRDAEELFGAARQIKVEIFKGSFSQEPEESEEKNKKHKIFMKMEEKLNWAVSFIYTPHPTISFSALICCCHHQLTA